MRKKIVDIRSRTENCVKIIHTVLLVRKISYLQYNAEKTLIYRGDLSYCLICMQVLSKISQVRSTEHKMGFLQRQQLSDLLELCYSNLSDRKELITAECLLNVKVKKETVIQNLEHLFFMRI